MKSPFWIVTGASCLSLAVGYTVGNSGSNKHTEGENLSTEKTHDTSGSMRPSQSVQGKNSHRMRPATAHGRADLAVRAAQKKLDESGMVMMDFSTVADVWNLLDNLNAEELEIALSGLKDSGNGMNQSAMMLKMMLVSRWADLDGQSAAEYTLSGDNKGMTKMVNVMGVMGSWMKNDPVAAEAWYEKNKEEFKGGMFGQDMVQNMFFNAHAKKDLNTAFSKLDLTKTSERNQAIEALGSLISDPNMKDQVIAKVQSFEDVKLRQKSWTKIIQSLAYSDPSEAKIILETINESDPEQYAKYQESYLNGMRHFDPAAALEYSMTEIQDKDKRTSAIKISFTSLATQDASAARVWLDAQSDIDKDDFIKSAAQTLRWQNPEDSMQWALEISDDDKRTDAVVETYNQWKEEHTTGAETWLAAQDPETREAILAEADDDE